MTAFQMPVTTAPGQHPHESGGRLINCYAEKLDGAAGTQVVVHRVPGLTGFATSSQTGFRGALQVRDVPVKSPVRASSAPPVELHL